MFLQDLVSTKIKMNSEEKMDDMSGESKSKKKKKSKYNEVVTYESREGVKFAVCILSTERRVEFKMTNRNTSGCERAHKGST